MQSRIGELALRLRIPEAERESAPRLRRAFERDLLPAALEACDRRLAEHFGPDVCVHLRALDFRARLDAQALDEAGAADRLGVELADGILAAVEATGAAERLRPNRDASVVLIRDDAHRDALRLHAACAAGERPWFASSASAQPWSEAIAKGARHLASVLTWLDRMDVLGTALQSAAPEERERVLELLPAEDRPASLDRLHRRQESASEAGELRARPATEERANPMGHAASDASRRDDEAREDPDGAPFEDRGAGSEPLGAIEERAPSAVADPRRSVRSAPGSSSLADEPRQRAARDGAKRIPTRFGGAFFFARLALELELGEQLWRAGAREGVFLRELLALLLGAKGRGDLAPRLFGGVPDELALAPMPSWAIEEVRTEHARSVEAWAARRGLALAAVETRDELARELVADASEQAPSAPALRLVADCAAGLVTCFCAAIGLESRRERWLELLAVDASVEETDEAWLVHLPMDSIDLRVRRAGLDLDPGYVPWLRRELRLVYA